MPRDVKLMSAWNGGFHLPRRNTFFTLISVSLIVKQFLPFGIRWHTVWLVGQAIHVDVLVVTLTDVLAEFASIVVGANGRVQLRWLLVNTIGRNLRLVIVEWIVSVRHVGVMNVTKQC